MKYALQFVKCKVRICCLGITYFKRYVINMRLLLETWNMTWSKKSEWFCNSNSWHHFVFLIYIFSFCCVWNPLRAEHQQNTICFIPYAFYLFLLVVSINLCFKAVQPNKFISSYLKPYKNWKKQFKSFKHSLFTTILKFCTYLTKYCHFNKINTDIRKNSSGRSSTLTFSNKFHEKIITVLRKRYYCFHFSGQLIVTLQVM